mmetsp:Transcript_41796/g.40149  ORF Transcript_41796/g.40149 Transcript_41796/m.40149 type:complete len:106 (+) Transcript_41796:1643-1960(+)
MLKANTNFFANKAQPIKPFEKPTHTQKASELSNKQYHPTDYAKYLSPRNEANDKSGFIKGADKKSAQKGKIQLQMTVLNQKQQKEREALRRSLKLQESISKKQYT